MFRRLTIPYRIPFTRRGIVALRARRYCKKYKQSGSPGDRLLICYIRKGRHRLKVKPALSRADAPSDRTARRCPCLRFAYSTQRRNARRWSRPAVSATSRARFRSRFAGSGSTPASSCPDTGRYSQRCPARATRDASKPFARLPAARLLEAELPHGVPAWIIDCPALYDRDGGPYQDAGGVDWEDNPLRFGLLSHVAARLASTQSPVAWRAQLVHANDWQTGLAPAYAALALGGATPSIITIHNLAFQGSLRAALGRRSRIARDELCGRRRRILRPPFVSQGRTLFRQRHHDGQSDLCPGDPERGDGHGLARSARDTSRQSHRDSERYRYDGLGSGERCIDPRAIRCDDAGAQGRQQKSVADSLRPRPA